MAESPSPQPPPLPGEIVEKSTVPSTQELELYSQEELELAKEVSGDFMFSAPAPTRATENDGGLESHRQDVEQKGAEPERQRSIIHRHTDNSATVRQRVLKNVFGIGPEFRGDESYMPESKLIYPHSKFGMTWIALTGIFLFYTATVTPPMISLFWLEDDCVISPTLWADTVLDIFFLLDIVVNFNTGVITRGEYYDSRVYVTKNYLCGFFLFDVLTSVPVSFVEHYVAQLCAESAGADAPLAAGEMRFVRVIKPLRWFKIARILKLAKGRDVVTSFMDHFAISPNQSKTLQVLVSLWLVLHLMACLWIFFKFVACSPEEIHTFLESQPFSANDPHVPLNTMRGKFQTWVIAMYVTVMTITTVGYGDISADNHWERIGYVLLFIAGAFIWGDLLATVGDISISKNLRKKQRQQKIQNTLDFLVENDCPLALRTAIIQWTRFHENHYDENIIKKKMIDELPATLQKGLVKHLYGNEWVASMTCAIVSSHPPPHAHPPAVDAIEARQTSEQTDMQEATANHISKVPLFAFIERVDDNNEHHDELQEKFLNEIFVRLEYKTYTPGEILVNFSDAADRMLIFIEGKVNVEFDHSQISREPLKLKDGDYIGDMALLSEHDWAKSTCFHFPPEQVDDQEEGTEIQVTPHPMSYVVALHLTRTAFQDTLEQAAPITQEAVESFHKKWQKTRDLIRNETDETERISLQQLRAWEDFVLRIKKKRHQELALEENREWKFAKAAKSKARRDDSYLARSKSKLTMGSPRDQEAANASLFERVPSHAGGDTLTQLAAEVKALDAKFASRFDQLHATQERILTLLTHNAATPAKGL